MLVHVILLRTDLGWPIGALATQAVHASNACLFSTLAQSDASSLQCRQFLESGSKMNVLVKEIPSLEQMHQLESELSKRQIPFHVWVEEPENIPVAIAIVPSERELIIPLVKKYSLFCCSSNSNNNKNNNNKQINKSSKEVTLNDLC